MSSKHFSAFNGSLASLVFLSAIGTATAQTVAPPLGSPLPGVERAVPPSTSVAPTPSPAAPAEVNPGLKVRITSVVLSGATIYSQSILIPDSNSLIGEVVPVAKIEAVRTAIVNRYRADGYVYTAVNAHIQGTVLRFIVAEGHVTNVKLDGNIGTAGTQVLKFLAPLTKIRPLTNNALERALLLANDVPGVTTHGVLTPSTQDPGSLTLVAQVSRARFSGEIQADNRAFRGTGPEELLGIFNINDLTSLGDQTQISLYHAPDNSDSFGQIAESLYLGGSGLKLNMYGGAGSANPTGTLALLGYQGFTRVFGAGLSYPVIRSRQQNLTVSALFDGLESDVSTASVFGRQRESFDSLRIFRLNAQDTLTDTWLGDAHSATDTLNVRFSQGVSVFGASRRSDGQLPRLNEQPAFTKINGELDRTQTLFQIGASSSVSIKGAIAGQFSNDVLPPEEKYYLGGQSFDRGFYYGEVTGDKAAQATVEPLLDQGLPEVSFLPSPLNVEFYGFYDWGEVWQNAALDLPHNLRSAGAGMRFYVGPRIEMNFEGVSRFTRTPQGSSSVVIPLPRSVFYWQIIDRF